VPSSVFQDVLDAEVAATPNIPGDALLVRAPGVEISEASGFFDRECRIRLEPGDGFRIASITKTNGGHLHGPHIPDGSRTRYRVVPGNRV
jgi:hypothetical protein